MNQISQITSQNPESRSARPRLKRKMVDYKQPALSKTPSNDHPPAHIVNSSQLLGTFSSEKRTTPQEMDHLQHNLPKSAHPQHFSHNGIYSDRYSINCDEEAELSVFFSQPTNTPLSNISNQYSVSISQQSTANIPQFCANSHTKFNELDFVSLSNAWVSISTPNLHLPPSQPLHRVASKPIVEYEEDVALPILGSLMPRFKKANPMINIPALLEDEDVDIAIHIDAKISPLSHNSDDLCLLLEKFIEESTSDEEVQDLALPTFGNSQTAPISQLQPTRPKISQLTLFTGDVEFEPTNCHPCDDTRGFVSKPHFDNVPSLPSPASQENLNVILE